MSGPPLQIDPVRRELPPSVRRLGWILTASGILIASAGYFLHPREAAFTTVVGFLFLTSIGAGSLFLIALEYIAGAVWSLPMRRVNEFLAWSILLAPLLALPVFFHLPEVFPWLRENALAADHLLKGKHAYLNLNFFLLRFILIFLVWIFFAWAFTRNSQKQDTTRDQRLTTINMRLAALFMPLFAFTLTLTAVDWAMSLEPRWFSTIFGVYYFSGTVLAALSATTYIVIRFHEAGYLPHLRKDHFYSLGALLFAFINFWAYIAFSQFLLIWYANLPEETFWFMARWQGGMEYVSILLIIVHFVVPYFLLLPQEAKMDTKRLKFMAVWILAAHLLDLSWLVIPSLGNGVAGGWTGVGYPLVITGMVILLLGFMMKRQSLIPVGDPKLQRGIDFRL